MAVLIFLSILALVFLFPSNRREVLIAFDQLLNARLGGYADETFSARCWRERTTKRKYAVLTTIINGIFFGKRITVEAPTKTNSTDTISQNNTDTEPTHE